MTQTTLVAPNSEPHVIDDIYRAGAYTGGEYDFEATQELLTERFAETSAKLPDEVNGFERQDVRYPYEAVYRRDGLTVTILPVGPYLHAWTVSLEHRTDSGWSTWFHPDASKLATPGSAVSTALAVMRGEVSAHSRRDV